MICLTGDVHQEFGSSEQEYYTGTEFDATLEYVDIAQSYGIDVTLFLTGKVVESNTEKIQNLSNRNGIEIGGHTWSAFRPQWIHTIFSQLIDSVYGPAWFQRRDIKRTLNAIEEQTGEAVRSWRTHAYNSNKSTYQILSDTSVSFISDQKRPERESPIEYNEYDLVEYPINIIPDHEHLIHASRTEQSVKRIQQRGWSDEFGSESFSPREWSQRVIDQLDKIEEADGLATLLIHPGCMKAADNFESFERICAHINTRGYVSQCVRDTRGE